MLYKPPKNEEGFTMIELLIVSVIMIIILAIMATILAGVQSNYRVFRERAAKHTDALAAMNLMVRVIRNAGDNTSQTPLVATGNNKLQIISDWTTTNNVLNDPFENVEFYVSNNTLFMRNIGGTANTIEIASNIESISFAYFDINGASTATMADVAMVRVTITIVGENDPLTSNVILRGKIQPK